MSSGIKLRWVGKTETTGARRADAPMEGVLPPARSGWRADRGVWKKRIDQEMRKDEPFGRKGRSVDAWNESSERDHALERAILAIPAGKVSTYGKVAEAAGYPRYHRAVARLLRGEHFDRLPWHRVVGANGEIKTSGSSAKEQRARLLQEGIVLKGERVALSVCLHQPSRPVGVSSEE